MLHKLTEVALLTRSVQTKNWLLSSGRTARSNDLNLDWIDRSLSQKIW